MGQPSIIYCQYSDSATATGSLTGNGNVSDVLIATEDTFYSPKATTSFNIVIDLAVATAFDSIGLLGHEMNSVTMEVRASTDNFATSDVSIDAPTQLVSSVNSAWVDVTQSTFQYVKFLFSGHPSSLRIADICIMLRPVMPYFETDPDIDNVAPTAVQLVSQAGFYVGSNQQKAMREMNLDWGEVTPTELVPIKAWSDACIKVVNPFFFIPDVYETDSFFCWIPSGGRFKSPYVTGVHKVDPITLETRAA